MPKASELVGASPKILAVGDAGSGKTAAVTSLGEGLELIDVDGNVLPALHCGDALDADRAQVEVASFVPQKMEDGPGMFDRIMKKVEEINRQATRGQYPYSALAIDSLTAVSDLGLMWAQKANGNFQPYAQPEQREWGAMARAVQRLVYLLKALPLPVIFIAHEELSEVSGEADVRLGLPGRVLNKDLPRTFSDIWFFRSRLGAGSKQVFEIHTRPFGAFRQAQNSAGLASPLDASAGLKPVLRQMGFPLPQPSNSERKEAAPAETP